MATYRCPVCAEEMLRDLILFLDHTHQHIIDEIKKSHPDWAASDGACRKCIEYFQNQFKK